MAESGWGASDALDDAFAEQPLRALNAALHASGGLEASLPIDAVVAGMQPEGLCYARLAKASAYARDRKRPFVGTNPDNTWPGGATELLPAGGPELMRRGLQRFEGIWRGFTGSGGLLVGPESRGSSPVRIPRDDDSRESTSTPGLYPMGEGAGYAGGIMSAALDGIRSARKLIEARAPAQ